MYASGNQATCTAQGFFTQFSIATVVYNGFLSLYYLLVIKYKWSDKKLSQKHFEIIAHVTSLGFGLLTCIVCASLGLFNPIGWDCWISAYPLGCNQSWKARFALDDNYEPNCERGDNANLYQWLFFYIPLWCIIVAAALQTFSIVREYRSTTKKTSAYRASSAVSANQERKNSVYMQKDKLIITQAFFYVGSFLVAWIFPTVLRFQEVFGETLWWDFIFLSAMFVPIQGFLNFLVYLRPRIINERIKRQIIDRRVETQKKYASAKSAVHFEDSKTSRISDAQQAPPEMEEEEEGGHNRSSFFSTEMVTKAINQIGDFAANVRASISIGDDGFENPNRDEENAWPELDAAIKKAEAIVRLKTEAAARAESEATECAAAAAKAKTYAEKKAKRTDCPLNGRVKLAEDLKDVRMLERNAQKLREDAEKKKQEACASAVTLSKLLKARKAAGRDSTGTKTRATDETTSNDSIKEDTIKEDIENPSSANDDTNVNLDGSDRSKSSEEVWIKNCNKEDDLDSGAKNTNSQGAWINNCNSMESTEFFNKLVEE